MVPSSVFAAPVVLNLTPEDDSVIGGTLLWFIVEFDEPIVAGSGNITLHKASDDSVVTTVDVGDAQIYEDGGHGYLYFEFSGGLELEFGTEYYFNIAAGAVTDALLDPFPGILDTTTWNFETKLIGTPTYTFARVSLTDAGEEFVTEFLSGQVEVSSDGRYVAFIASDEENNTMLFLRDVVGESTALIADALGNSTVAFDISDDGRFIAYGEPNDLLPEDTNAAGDLYLYDSQGETLELVSVNEGGLGGFGDIQSVSMSSDLRYIAFFTHQRLVPGAEEGSNLYIRDRQEETTTLLFHGEEQYIDLSPQGDSIAMSAWTGFDEIDVNDDRDVYVYDILEDSFELISVTEDGSAAAGQSGFEVGFSSSGRYVLFLSTAATIVTGVGGGESRALYVFDRDTVSSTHIAGGDESFVTGARFSDDERYVVYTLSTYDEDAQDSFSHVYRHELETGEDLFITEGAETASLVVANSTARISANGSIVTFASDAVNLVDDDENLFKDIFQWEEDTVSPVITLLGVTPVEHTLGDPYTDAGATAEDDTQGDITDDIIVGGDVVDTNTVGTYVITYNVEDVSGNPAVEVTRTVNVNAAEEEEEEEDEGGGGGGGSSSRNTSVTPTGPASQEEMVKSILEQLILVLQQLIQQLLAQRS